MLFGTGQVVRDKEPGNDAESGETKRQYKIPLQVRERERENDLNLNCRCLSSVGVSYGNTKYCDIMRRLASFGSIL